MIHKALLMQRKKKFFLDNLSGYFTVEAALVMSMVLFCLVSLIYIGFYQYNCCRLPQDLYRIALKGSSLQFASGNEEVLSKMQQENERYPWYKYLSVQTTDTLVSMNHNVISVSKSFKMWTPFSIFNNWKKEETAHSTYISPAKQIRAIRKILDKEVAD